MNTYIFSGKILPERAAITVSNPIQINVQAIDAAISFNAVISIGVSQVSIAVKTKDKNVDVFTLKNYVENLVRVEVDVLGYLWGRGYDVEITSAVESNGQQVVFGVGIPELEATQKERPLPIDELFRVVIKSEHLRRALGDLRETIRSTLDTGFFCYRAVESISQHFTKENEDKKLGWERMRNSLRIDKSWIEDIKELADMQRHGKTPYMSGKDRVLVMHHAWKVIDRFCIYAHRDFKSLPENEFDLLKEINYH